MELVESARRYMERNVADRTDATVLWPFRTNLRAFFEILPLQILPMFRITLVYNWNGISNRVNEMEKMYMFDIFRYWRIA